MDENIYFKIIIVMVLITITITAQNDESLVAHYKFSKEYYDNQVEGKFYDLSGNGNHAIPSDTFHFVEDHLGNLDGAMWFDGENDYLNCGNSRNLNIDLSSYTILLWIKPYSKTSSI